MRVEPRKVHSREENLRYLGTTRNMMLSYKNGNKELELLRDADGGSDIDDSHAEIDVFFFLSADQ